MGQDRGRLSTDRSAHRGVSGQARSYSTTALVVATILFGLALRTGVLSSLAAVIGTALLGLAMLATRGTPSSGSGEGFGGVLLISVLVFAVTTVLQWPPRGIGPTSDALEILPGLIWAALAVFVYTRGPSPSRPVRITIVAIIIAFTAAIGMTHITSTGGVGLDVMVLHTEAADALRNGLNPYTDAVTVANGAPTAAPGDVIEGYVYPPVTGILYALGVWSLSDPRYTSLLGWLIFLGVVGAFAMERDERSPLLVLLAMAAIPGWPLVLRAAWTEPVSLGLAALAFRYWRRPTGSGLFTGLMLGSKQYFVVAAPLLVLYRGKGWLRRVIWASVAVIVTVGSALLWDFSSFWSSAVEFHLSTPPRADSQNMIGLLAGLGIDWTAPSWLPLGVGLAASIIAGMWARGRSQWFVGLAFTLAASFLVSSQAFPNYWFLIAGLCGMALLDRVSAPSHQIDPTGSSDLPESQTSRDHLSDRYSSTT